MNADIHKIDVVFVEEVDDFMDPIGVRDVGEIGMLSVAAAIGNAMYHTTGKRVRNLPYMIDKLL